ncbi:MAG: response regulator transcription factor [Ktedonobacterales bacterium]
MTRVLVVDDDRAIRDLLVMALEMEDYAVATLCDGSAVVETLEAAHEPWVVLLDVMMPQVDGLEVCRQLAARGDLAARHRVVVMTACPPLDGEPPEPAVALLAKPFQLAHLLHLVETLAVGATSPAVTAAGSGPAECDRLSLAH